ITIVVVVGEVGTHARICLAVGIGGDHGHQAGFLEGPVPLVAVEELDHGVVGDKQVDVAVAAVVGNGNAQAFAGLPDSDAIGDFGETAVAVVVEDERLRGLEGVGMAISAAAFAMLAAV